MRRNCPIDLFHSCRASTARSKGSRLSKHRSNVVTGLPHTQCESDFCQYTAKQSPHKSNAVIGHNPIQTPSFTASRAQIPQNRCLISRLTTPCRRSKCAHPDDAIAYRWPCKLSKFVDETGGEIRINADFSQLNTDLMAINAYHMQMMLSKVLQRNQIFQAFAH